MKTSWIVKTIAALFAAAGLLALGYCALEYESARRYQMRETRRFTEQRLSAVAASSVAPAVVPSVAPAYPSLGSAVALLKIPRVGLSAIVVEGAGERELKWGPGHIPGTSFPGKSPGSGNTGIAGHRDTFFRPLRFVRMGDTIEVSTLDDKYLYKVVSTRIVSPEDTQVLDPTGHETLTLVTCYPFDFVGAAPKRFIVRADAIK